VDTEPTVVDPMIRVKKCFAAKDFDSAWQNLLVLPNSEEALNSV